MKKINTVLLGLLFFFLYSCESTDMDEAINPSDFSPNFEDVDFLLNSSFLHFAKAAQRYGEIGAELTRIDYMNGGEGSYLTTYSEESYNVVWRQTYNQVFENLQLMMPLAQEADLPNHIGMGKVLQAYLMITLVDMFGDVPYFEALDPTNNYPRLDTGEAVYTEARSLLDQAIEHFNQGSFFGSEFEPFYNNNFSRWIKLANSLKMKIYIQTRLVDSNALSKFEQIVSSGNYITEPSDNFVWNWSTQNTTFNTRHPHYEKNYQAAGADGYRSNWLMDYMNNNKTVPDPRIRYYFYRQSSSLPTNPNQQAQFLDCLIKPVPPHYIAAGVVYCFPGQDTNTTSPPYNLEDAQGYWGRDHGNQSNPPSDNRKKTAVGLYPAGGQFDDNTFQGINGIDRGAFGAGITPLLLSSTIDFWKAEAALFGGNGDPITHISIGIAKSISYVRTFIDRHKDQTRPINQKFIPNSLNDAKYIIETIENYKLAAGPEEKLDILGKEFFVSLYGNGMDAYNFYRRTGAPRDIQPHLNPNPGGYIRSHLYPANLVHHNKNIDQKPGVTQRVFWDTNPQSGFPQNN